MDQPTNYAIAENGVVANVIWLCDSNASDFPTAVSVQGRLVAVGDTLENGVFTWKELGGDVYHTLTL